MRIVVQKYGGTSVGSAERIKRVAAKIGRTRAEGTATVAVVSAMGDTTDDLIELARAITHDPDPRELDVLLHTGEIVSSTLMAMALRELGIPAVSLTGAQAGIKTDAIYSRARIRDLTPKRIERELDRGRVVIVAGFQGITDEDEITTLGRGGSDTTAVAIAAALKAERCEIYTDVEGILTADPRIVPSARKLADVSYEEMLELAQHGARVMHPRAVELGEVYGTPIYVASSFGDTPGTLIHGGPYVEYRNKVRGIAHDADVAKITVLGVPDRPGIAALIFAPLAEASVNVDTIVQNASEGGLTDLSFTVARGDLDRALRLVEPQTKAIEARGTSTAGNLAKVSIVGSGIQNAPGYAARMFKSLYEHGVNINMITTSEIRITCIVEESQVVEAVRALHAEFGLDEMPDGQTVG